MVLFKIRSHFVKVMHKHTSKYLLRKYIVQKQILRIWNPWVSNDWLSYTVRLRITIKSHSMIVKPSAWWNYNVKCRRRWLIKPTSTINSELNVLNNGNNSGTLRVEIVPEEEWCCECTLFKEDIFLFRDFLDTIGCAHRMFGVVILSMLVLAFDMWRKERKIVEISRYTTGTIFELIRFWTKHGERKHNTRGLIHWS